MAAAEAIERFQLDYSRNLQMDYEGKKEVRNRVAADSAIVDERDIASAAERAAAERYLRRDELALWNLSHPRQITIEPVLVMGSLTPTKVAQEKKEETVMVSLLARDGTEIEIEATLTPQEAKMLQHDPVAQAKPLLFSMRAEPRPMRIRENGRPVRDNDKALARYLEKEYMIVARGGAREELMRLTFVLRAAGGGNVEIDASLTAAEAETLRRASESGNLKPIFSVLYDLYDQNRVAEVRENGRKVKLNDKEFGRYVSQDYTGIAVNEERNMGSAVAEAEPSERLKKKTAVAMVFEVGNYAEIEAPLSGRGANRFVKANRFVMTFEPTDDELAEFRHGAPAFREALARRFRDAEQRQAFLGEHPETHVFVPPEGIMTATGRRDYPRGIALTSEDAGNFIRDGLFGPTFDAFGYHYASGFRIVQGARLASLDTKPRDIMDAMPSLIVPQKPEDDLPRKADWKVTITSEKRSTQAVEFTVSDQRTVTAVMTITPSEQKRLEEAARSQSDDLLRLLGELEKSKRILRLSEGMTRRRDIDSAIAEYAVIGLRSVGEVKKPYEAAIEADGQVYTVNAVMTPEEAGRLRDARSMAEMQPILYWWQHTGAVSSIKIGDDYQDPDAVLRHFMSVDVRVLSVGLPE